MIPVELFIAMLAVDIILAIYAFIDIDNIMFGNVIAAVVSSIISFLLGIQMIAGSVGSREWVIAGINETYSEVYNTTIISNYHEIKEIPIYSGEYSLILIGFAIIMALVSFGFILDVFLQYVREV